MVECMGHIQIRNVPEDVHRTLKERAAAFHKPVVLVHGDTHHYRLDHPWKDVPTFTRVETFASDEANRWVRGVVDPDSRQVFSFTTETAH